MDARLRRHELGFLEVIDRPSPEELRDYYAKTYYQSEKGSYRKEYSPDELEVFALNTQQRATQAFSIRGKDTPGKLLDVGCGEGFVLRDFHQWGWTVEGIDFSRAGVDRMNPEMARFVHQGDVFDLLEERIASGATFDLAWLGNVLEHVLDPLGLLRSLRRLLTEDGVLVVTVPNDGTPLQEDLLERGQIPDRFWVAIPDHMSYFNTDNLPAVAEAAGWNCVALHGGFPIDCYLAHSGSNYVVDRSRGPIAHKARLQLELLIGRHGPDAANALYEALAGVGMGRDLAAYMKPKNGEQGDA